MKVKLLFFFSFALASAALVQHEAKLLLSNNKCFLWRHFLLLKLYKFHHTILVLNAFPAISEGLNFKIFQMSMLPDPPSWLMLTPLKWAPNLEMPPPPTPYLKVWVSHRHLSHTWLILQNGQCKTQTADFCFHHANEYMATITIVHSQSAVCILRYPPFTILSNVVITNKLHCIWIFHDTINTVFDNKIEGLILVFKIQY